MSHKRRTFTIEFKLLMVKLYENGKPVKDIIREYDVATSTLYKWIKSYQETRSFTTKSKLIEECLRKENQRLLNEADILRQALLIIGRK
ncbi:transposase [Kurthia populi]|uniref:Transposase n=1 Tax=Kurthia populi TaxID=1562132 RepID=A0ABW5XYX7_9BACL